MNAIVFTEPEIQLLIALIELEQPVETPNNNHYHFYPKSLEEAAAYFKSLRVDWTPAYASLEQGGLLVNREEGAQLTEIGKVEANRLRGERPPIYYWYQEYYHLAPSSMAYRTFCERLYGKYLCQTNFSDLEQLEKLLLVSHLKPGSTALDLGCGIGLIAEYLADRSGARFWGIDYSPEAIQQALARTQSQRDRLNFRVANMDSLDFPAESFDVILSIDTLYMPNDLPATLCKLLEMLRPGGELLVYYSQAIWDAKGDREALKAENTSLGVALRSLGLTYQTWDFSEQNHRHMQRKKLIGEDLRPAFEAEGNLILYDYIIAESLDPDQPYDLATSPFTRYLYRVEK